MLKETEIIEEYRTPKCKVVQTHVQNLLCVSFGEEGEAGEKVKVEYDDYDY